MTTDESGTVVRTLDHLVSDVTDNRVQGSIMKTTRCPIRSTLPTKIDEGQNIADFYAMLRYRPLARESRFALRGLGSIEMRRQKLMLAHLERSR